MYTAGFVPYIFIENKINENNMLEKLFFHLYFILSADNMTCHDIKALNMSKMTENHILCHFFIDDYLCLCTRECAIL